jgi:hypothetical protein
MILRLTPTMAQFLGETPREWQALEDAARFGRWTGGPRDDALRLRRLAVELQAGARVEAERS